MKRTKAQSIVVFLAITVVVGALAESRLIAADWPSFGRDGTRNAVSPEKGPPTLWRPEKRDRDGKIKAEAQGVRWTAKLGLQCYSSPVVSGGLVWIGCGDVRLIKGVEEYISLLQCFRAVDGERIYEYASPQLNRNRWQDAGWTGLGSSPLIEGDRLWIMTNRCELVCLDIGPLIRGEGDPRELWKLDCIKQFDIHPRVLIMGPPLLDWAILEGPSLCDAQQRRGG